MIHTFKVTQEIIDRGIPNSPCDCPVAIALRQQLLPNAQVGGYKIWFDPDDYRFITIPEHIRTFITSFDHGRPVQPFEFELNIA